MAKIWVDGREFEVDPSRNMLEVCLELGFDLPYFCWHPALGSVGACRQCAVKQFKDEHDSEGQIVMACMTSAAEGTRISVSDPEAVAFRAHVIEWLMLNHPHDCPICDEGGECHLQDMTVMTGHNYRRTRFRKRTHRNQYLGPLVNHEMNRCIQCYRCVRFYHDYAGGRDLFVMGSHDHVYFGRHEDGVLESEFSGNLVEVCPTGVFTDKTLKRHYTRKWDLQMAPSVCVHCSLGCNVSPGERYGTLRRVVNRYNEQVNGYFLCDRGRYGYEFVNHERRLASPMVRDAQDGELRESDGQQALARARDLLAGCDRVIGIGSPRASLETNLAVKRLVGADAFVRGVARREADLADAVLEVLQGGPAPVASVREAEDSDAVVVLGENVADTAPRLALALRQAVRNQPMQIADDKKIPRWHDSAVREALQHERGPLFIATPDATRLDDVARRLYRADADAIARLGFAAAHEVDPDAPGAEELDDATRELAAEVADALGAAERPLVVAGVTPGSVELVHAAANLAWALRRRGRDARILLVLPESNSMGTALLGGLALEAAEEAVGDEGRVALVVAENDLSRRLPEADVKRLLSGAAVVVALDVIDTAVTRAADVVLPAAAFAESDGTLVSCEGRAQRFFTVYRPASHARPAWRWLRELGVELGWGEMEGWESLDDVVSAVAAQSEMLSGVRGAAPGADFRLPGGRVPRQAARYSGRTAMHADVTVHEPRPPEDRDAPLSFSMEGGRQQPPPSLVPSFWAPRWNSIQAVNKFQEEIPGELRGGPAGARLITAGEARAYFDDVPTTTADGWRAVPAPPIYGSEELSSLAPGLAELAAAPTFGVSMEDAAELGVSDGDPLALTVGGQRLELPVRVQPQLARRLVTVPVGVAGVPVLRLPGAADVKRGG